MLIEINSSDRVGRGGSWSFIARYCEVTYRDYIYPYYRVSSVGFRVLRRCINVNKNKRL